MSRRVQRRCAVCQRLLRSGRGRACVRGCGAWLCRTRHRPQCSDVHGQGCPNRPMPDDQEAAA